MKEEVKDSFNGPTTSTGLLKDLGGGADSARWTEFVRLYEPLFRYWLAGFHKTHPTLPRMLDDDIVQETLVFMMKAFPAFKYDPSRGRFRGFLYQSLRNKALKVMESYRLLRGGKVMFDSDVAETIGDQTAQPEAPVPGLGIDGLHREIWDILLRRVFSSGKYSQQSQTIFRLVVEDEFSAEEIGARYGLKANAVYQLKSRILTAMKRHLAAVRSESDNLVELLDALLAEEVENGRRD